MVQDGETAADEQDEQDDGDDHDGVAAAKDLYWSCEPSPYGEWLRLRQAEGGRVEDLTPILEGTLILTGRDKARQDPRADHEDEKDEGRRDKCALADTGA
jgi:hypothetical protein